MDVEVNDTLSHRQRPVGSTSVQGDRARFENAISLRKTEVGWQIASLLLRIETA
ncbi:MAG: hypothetical protein AAGF99_17795 [Bacteroidota bacterium]